MKKTIFLGLILLFAVACGPGKVAKEARATFDGGWVLTDVTYPNNSGEFNVTLLNDVSAECMENSTWDFVSNNNRGSYTVVGADCDSGERNFIWSIDDANAQADSYDFLLKPTDDNYDSTTGDQGFRMNLVSLSGSSMIWEQTVTLEGSPFVIRMNFNKQ